MFSVFHTQSSTAAIKNMPTIPIVSITKLKVAFSIITQILQLNNALFPSIGVPNNFNFWGEENSIQLHLLQGNLIIDLRIRRQNYYTPYDT